MTSGEHSGDNDPQSRLKLPDPSDVARSVALRTGNFAINPDVYTDRGGILDVRLQIAENELHSGTAVVRLEHLSDEGSQPQTRTVSEAAIGHFVPELDSWAMYPEYIPADENQLTLLKIYIQNLSQTRDNVMHMRTQAEVREPFVDLRHVSTTRLRKMTSILLQSSGLHNKLIGHQNVLTDGTVIRRDGSTTSHAIIAPRFDDGEVENRFRATNSVFHALPKLQPTQTMSIVYSGAIFSRDSQHSTRGEHVVHVATRDEYAPGVWLPTQDIFTPLEMQVLESIRGGIMTEKQIYEDFLADRCAVGYCMSDSFTFQS